MSGLGRLVGSRLGWALVIFASVGLIAVAATRDAGPRTPDQRIESIAERIACPVCDGESVLDSRNPTSAALLERIKIDVRAGQMSDDEIINSITSARQGQELLIPTATGVEALAWALPAAAFVLGSVGLGLAFARWRREATNASEPTESDFHLVAAAIAANQPADDEQTTTDPTQIAAPSVVDDPSLGTVDGRGAQA